MSRNEHKQSLPERARATGKKIFRQSRAESSSNPKRAKSQLNIDALMAAIVDSSDDAIISKDLNGVITSWNEGAVRLFGYTAEEVIGKPVTILMPTGRADEEPYILERISRGEKVNHYETVRRRKDGSEIDISLTISPVRDKSGKVIGASKIARDISERKRSERDRAMLSEISDQLAELTDIEKTMERLGENIGRYFGVKQCMFAETEDFETSVVSYGWNADGPPSLKGSCRTRDFLSEWRLAANLAGELTVVNDTQNDSRVSAEIYGALNIHSFIIVPFVRAGAWRFMLSIINDQPRKWRDDEVDLMREITERIWTRLERARAVEALHESEAWLRSQKEALQAAMNDAPLEASLGVLVRIAVERFAANVKAAFYVADDDGASLTHVVGMSDTYAQYVDGFKISANSLAMRRGEPVITPDVMCDPQWQPWLWLAQESNYRASWSFPVRTTDGPVLGALALYFSEPRQPTSRDFEMAGVLTHAATIIISRHKEVSERAHAEEKLRESGNQLRVITDAMPALISYIDRDCRYRFVNQTYTDWFGHAGAEVIGRTMADVLGAAAFEVLRPHVEVALAGKTVLFEAETPYRDGGSRFVRANYTPDVAPDGAVRGFFVLVLDITESKKAEEMLREAQSYLLAAERRNAERLRELNVAAVEINAATSVEEVISLINNKARELIGARMAVVNLVPDGDWKRARTVVSLSDERPTWRDYDAPMTSEGVYMSVVREKRTMRMTQAELELRPTWRGHGQETGNHSPLRGWLAAPLLGGNDECVGLVQLTDKWVDGKAGEFTEADEALLQQLAQVGSVALENHQLYEQEQEAREMAEQATRAKDEFLAIVSHELRSPLNAILGWNRMLSRQRGDDPQIAKVVETVERSGKAQLQLIEDLLDTTRIVTGKIKLELAPVELADVVSLALEALRPAADNKGIVIDTNFDPEAGQITGDPDRLQQIVWNLASNAIKFTPEGGRVWVELRRGGPGAQIVVRDTGQGISADLLPYVFDRFKQGDSSTSRRLGGLGLGLALVKHLVELHGGGVTVESPGEGRGATFTVSLPVRAIKGGGVAEGRKHGGSTFERRVRQEPPATRLDGVRALVVDDEAGARELLAVTLGLRGVSVTAADSADAAIAEIESRLETSVAEPFDVLISDIGMPGADGYELIRRVREHWDGRVSRTRAIALTAYARSEDRRRALQAGFHMHVPKPVDEEELTIVIAALTAQVTGA